MKTENKKNNDKEKAPSSKLQALSSKFDMSMLDFLCCPICHKEFEYKQKESVLVCSKCRKEFIVKDNIPILLV